MNRVRSLVFALSAMILADYTMCATAMALPGPRDEDLMYRRYRGLDEVDDDQRGRGRGRGGDSSKGHDNDASGKGQAGSRNDGSSTKGQSGKGSRDDADRFGN